MAEPEAEPTGNVSPAAPDAPRHWSLASALPRRSQCPSGWSMSQETRPDGATDTSYYTRDTGRRLNSLAAVLRYLRVRLPAHTHTPVLTRHLAPPVAPPSHRGASRCREGAGSGAARVQRGRFGKVDRARVGVALLGWWRPHGARRQPGLGRSRCGGAGVPRRCRCD